MELQGGGQTSAHTYCNRLMIKHKTSMVVLLETQLSGWGLAKALHKLPRDMSRYDIPSMGRSRGIIALWWCSGCSVDVIPAESKHSWWFLLMNPGIHGFLLECMQARVVASDGSFGRCCLAYKRLDLQFATWGTSMSS